MVLWTNSQCRTTMYILWSDFIASPVRVWRFGTHTRRILPHYILTHLLRPYAIWSMNRSKKNCWKNVGDHFSFYRFTMVFVRDASTMRSQQVVGRSTQARSAWDHWHLQTSVCWEYRASVDVCFRFVRLFCIKNDFAYKNNTKTNFFQFIE